MENSPSPAAVEDGSAVTALEGGSAVEGGSVVMAVEGGSPVTTVEEGSAVTAVEGGGAELAIEGGSAVTVMEGGGNGSGAASPRSEEGKLFVGGISWVTTEDTLKDYFNKYGEVKDAIIIRDKEKSTSRGFGFVSFSDPSSAEAALQDCATNKHVILARKVEVKRAVPKGDRYQYQHRSHNYDQYQANKASSRSNDNNISANCSQSRTKKIFVGGLSADLKEDEFKEYFEKFGKINDVVVMYDSTTQRPRGFGFITFDSEEAVQNAIEESFHVLKGKKVEVKRAVPKDNVANGNQDNHKNGNGYSGNPRMGNGGGNLFGNRQGGVYNPYSNTYGTSQGYMHFAGYGYGGSYLAGGYGGLGYYAHVPSPRSSWNYLGYEAARRIPISYYYYPGHYSSGTAPYLGMADCARGIADSADMKCSQSDADVQTPVTNGTAPSPVEVGKSEDQ